MPNPGISEETRKRIIELHQQGYSQHEISRVVGVDRKVIRREIAIANQNKVEEDHSGFEEFELPEPIEQSWEPFAIDQSGWWGVLSDTHLPCHDKRTIQSWNRDVLAQGKECVGILLNGDVMDMFSVSPYFRIPTKERLIDEIECGRNFFKWLRQQHPHKRIVFKLGNHDERFLKYLVDRAPLLADFPEFQLDSILGLHDLGIEVVQDKRRITMGKLNIFHGHEFRGSGGVNPARWLFLRSISTAMVGHFHRTSEHVERAADGRFYSTWSLGCACFEFPHYDPTNKWNHGYAMVELFERDGDFEVINRRILPDGRVR